ncbi:hypothetical protein [Nonomuraea basaltis]|uniref:hypothetical protein n=1 Tax=Nonomuraea basaltis TaxID=2495887 RepID=UPI00110C50D2|nr:hypothetical protein [Nonomuraea basaltis]TMR90532.1 hypothetical protein EJK15_54805 [Nonomuraea basaltis]
MNVLTILNARHPYTIDYERDRGPFWFVVVDNVVLDPEHPLPERHVDDAFHRAVRDYPGQEIGVAPCTPEDLANAGIPTHREEPA